MSPLITARALGWEARQRRILGPLDLQLEVDESVVVIGPNGAGKTTLLRLLAGVLDPTAGEVLWCGTPYRELKRRVLARHLAYVPQIRPARIPFTVEELVLSARFPHLSRLQLAPSSEDFEAVERALELARLGEIRHRPLDELSGGERQLAFVAAGLAQESEVLVLDEPTTHLDPRHQREVVGLLERIRTERAVVTATHDLQLAATVADRVVALSEGEILAAGAPADVLSPDVLGRLFEAPFHLVQVAGRSLPLVDPLP